jgi:hypothetical protein
VDEQQARAPREQQRRKGLGSYLHQHNYDLKTPARAARTEGTVNSLNEVAATHTMWGNARVDTHLRAPATISERLVA